MSLIVTVERSSDDELEFINWRFYFDDSSMCLRLSHVSVNTRSSKRHKFQETARFGIGSPNEIRVKADQLDSRGMLPPNDVVADARRAIIRMVVAAPLVVR